MKKILLGIIIGVAVSMPATLLASGGYPANSVPQLIGGAGCSTVVGNDDKIYPSRCNVDFRTFTYHGHRCFVAIGGSNGDASSISCVQGRP